ncbi:hypothetical protein LshimejAT787_0900420 [Lyophyllum shimeji]|uniref:Uncharacterized protein n=1 Tax=Lyophyllum shimeji TaxID=47721 RepID=A0A9P3UQ19_LYOSH|nr:hypothetical protein LshimejAT787_0900420 [Lyophyllum shimeji]
MSGTALGPAVPVPIICIGPADASQLLAGPESAPASEFLQRTLVIDRRPVLLVGESTHMSTICALAGPSDDTRTSNS